MIPSVATFANKSLPLYLPYTMNPTFSTIVSKAELIEPGGGASAFISGNGTGSVSMVMEALQGQTVQIGQSVFNSNASTIQQFISGIPAGSSNAITSYTTYDLAGNATVKGAIGFYSTLTDATGVSGSGGVYVLGQGGESLQVGPSNHIIATAASGNLKLDTSFNESLSTCTQAFYIGTSNASQLTFNNGALAISKINSTPLPTCQVVALSNYAPVIPASNQNVPLVTFSNLLPNNFYRVGFSATFANANGTPNSNAYISLYGFGSGAPSDAESIGSVNCLDMVQNPGAVPGNMGAAAAFFSCIFAPYTDSWTVYGSSGINNNLDVNVALTRMYLEKLL